MFGVLGHIRLFPARWRSTATSMTWRMDSWLRLP